MESLDNMFRFFENNSIKIKNIDIKELRVIQDEIDKKYKDGLISEYIYNRYLKRLNYGIPKEFPTAKSVFLIVYPQTLKKVSFLYNEKKYIFEVPPQYEYKFDYVYGSVVNSFLSQIGFRAIKIDKVPPLKLLAARSGMGKYGKNNLVYVDGMGSFNKIILFYSDYIVDKNTQLRSIEFMKRCKSCMICRNNCPTKIISNENKIIDAKKCITQINESKDKFPSWFDRKNMKCIIGCMECQVKCPANFKYKDNITYTSVFNNDETNMILKNEYAKHMPEGTYNKLENLGLVEYMTIISRNLNILFENNN